MEGSRANIFHSKQPADILKNAENALNHWSGFPRGSQPRQEWLERVPSNKRARFQRYGPEFERRHSLHPQPRISYLPSSWSSMCLWGITNLRQGLVEEKRGVIVGGGLTPRSSRQTDSMRWQELQEKARQDWTKVLTAKAATSTALWIKMRQI